MVDIKVVEASYGWTIGDDGEVFGLTMGDMGYTETGIVVPTEHLNLWALHNSKAIESAENESTINISAWKYDGVYSRLKDEPSAFKRACFRDGWNACLEHIKKELGKETV